jgi:glutaredoxin 3
MLRCEQHGLAIGPDGRCALCRRERAEPTVSPTSVLGLGGVLFAIVLTAVVVRERINRREAATAEELMPARAVEPAGEVEGTTLASPTASGSRRSEPARGRAPLLERAGAAPTRTPTPARMPAPGPVPVEAPVPVEEPPSMPAPIVAGPTRIDRAIPPQSVGIVMYTTSWCPRCKEAKAWMAANGVAYTEKDIEANDANMAECRRYNPKTSIPTTIVDGAVLVGFEDRYFRDAIDAAARKRRELGR